MHHLFGFLCPFLVSLNSFSTLLLECIQLNVYICFFWAALALVALQVSLQKWRAAALLSLCYEASRRGGFSCIVEPGPQGSWASVVAADQGSNPCLLHWQVGSLLLTYQGIPGVLSKKQSWVCHSLHKLLEWLSSALFYNPNLFNSLKWHSEIYPLFHDSCILCLPPKTTLSKGFQASLCLSLTG